MSTVRDLGRKIQSLKNMQKVTGAMNMISSIKLRKYMVYQDPLNRFQESTDLICSHVCSTLEHCEHPVIAGHDKETRSHLILFTADKGLCGIHNSSVLKAADVFVKEQQDQGKDVDVTCFGIKGINHARREGWNISSQAEMNERTLDNKKLEEVGHQIFQRFIAEEIHRVWILGRFFQSTLQQETERQQLLPVISGTEPPGKDFLQTEPKGDKLALVYGRTYLLDKLQIFMTHSFLSEHSSRLTAMENATHNSEDMIDKYVTIQNHARQATITNELIEIVSGKEALKG